MSVETKTNTIEKARKIAIKDLRKCYNKWGTFASLVNFSDYWARDSFWASLGMMAIGDFSQAKKNLEIFMKFQHENGKISRKISTDFYFLKYLLKIKLKRKKFLPIYTSPLHSNFSLDDNLLFVISFCEYIRSTKDLEYAKKKFRKVVSALNFYAGKRLVKDSLLVEKGLASWMDTIYKKGHVLYSNCLWYEAVRRFEELSKKVSTAKKTPSVLPNSRKIHDNIRKKFWLGNKGYFADSINGTKIDSTFDLAGNSLAVLFGIAKKREAEKIFKKIDSSRKVLHPVNTPPYPWWRINTFASLAGIYHYHNGISWSWTEAIILAAKIKAGKIASAKKDAENFSRVIVEMGHVFETYRLDGRPFGNFFWKSAVPFAWGSGLFLFALKEVTEAKR